VKMLNNQEAAEFLGIDPKTLYNWRCEVRKNPRASGPGPKFWQLPGQNPYYLEDDLIDFMGTYTDSQLDRWAQKQGYKDYESLADEHIEWMWQNGGKAEYEKYLAEGVG
jgi:hypothetical protein